MDGDTNGQTDVFVHDREMGTTERVSVDSIGTQTLGTHFSSRRPSISADGRYVAFESYASNLVDDDSNGETQDIFVHDRVTKATELVNVHSNGTQANGLNPFSGHNSQHPSISADGRYVAFDSHASNLVDGDTNEQRDIFVHDRETGTTERVSVRIGVQSDGGSFDASISADGRYVAFQSSASNLVDGDTNGLADIFVHDRETGTTERVNVKSDGTQPTGNGNHSGSTSISADGRTILFSTQAPMVAGDDNGQSDVFAVNNPLYDATGVKVVDGADGTAEGSETWDGSGPESLFNAVNNEGYVGDQAPDYYDQVQPGTSDSSDVHGPPDNIRGH